MSTTLATVYQHPKNLSAFRSGTNWFVGVSARKHTDLLDQLTPLVESGSIDAQRLETTVQTFLDWFRDKYRQAQQQDCPYEDGDIVESVGIILIEGTGKIRVEVLGRFQFWAIKNEQIDNITNQMQVTDATFIIADPKHTDVVKSVKQSLNQATGEELVSSLTEISYPFALLKTSNQSKSVLWYHYTIIGIISVALMGGWLFWQKQGMVELPASSGVVRSDPARITPLDTSATKPTHIAEAESPVNEKTKPVMELNVAHRPSPSQPVNQAEVKQDEPQRNQTADHFYEEAERSLSFARASIADGKNKKALVQLETAIYNYQQYLVRKPEMKHIIQSKLNEIRQKRSLIENDAL